MGAGHAAGPLCSSWPPAWCVPFLHWPTGKNAASIRDGLNCVCSAGSGCRRPLPPQLACTQFQARLHGRHGGAPHMHHARTRRASAAGKSGVEWGGSQLLLPVPQSLWNSADSAASVRWTDRMSEICAQMFPPRRRNRWRPQMRHGKQRAMLLRGGIGRLRNLSWRHVEVSLRSELLQTGAAQIREQTAAKMAAPTRPHCLPKVLPPSACPTQPACQPPAHQL